MFLSTKYIKSTVFQSETFLLYLSVLFPQLSTSLKINIDSWNKKTLVWLRRVVYDRAPIHNTLAVFACSAFWHGFYPGYYIMFGSGAFMTIVARQVMYILTLIL